MTRPERPKVPLTGGEREILTSQLDYLRATVAWKSEGLTDEQARRVHLPSELTTVAGLLGHLTLNEWFWFAVVVDGEEDTWDERLEADPDAEFRFAAQTPVPQLLADYAKQSQRSREIVAARDLDDQVTHKGETFNVRWVLTHMIEETARHTGHFDVLRELTDGLTGE
ncbi:MULTISPECIES: DinB family protein [unclassified Amycolatopsis]|uniref:DinB family protein n=1 Tax=unclassified Amycolatopsis TaxID=2618356 RepID=UPI001FF528A8|nr:DinB family protein [Amycolatopsis sp. FBCC-B4732]UOX92907.1 DinB family protein [Amycolatopsis sp. FBCC-B4732]